MMMNDQRLKRRTTTTTAIAVSSSKNSGGSTTIQSNSTSNSSNSSSSISILETTTTTNHTNHTDNGTRSGGNRNRNSVNSYWPPKIRRRRRKRRTTSRSTGSVIVASVVSWLVTRWHQSGRPALSSSTRTMPRRWIQVLYAKNKGRVLLCLGIISWSILVSLFPSNTSSSSGGRRRSLLRRATKQSPAPEPFHLLFPTSASSSLLPWESVALPPPRRLLRAKTKKEADAAPHARHHEEKKETNADEESEETDDDEETEDEEGAESVVGADDPDYGTIQIGYTNYPSNNNVESTSKTETLKETILSRNHQNPQAGGGGIVGRRREILPDGRGSDGEAQYRDYDTTPGYIDDENDAYYAFDDDYIKGIDGIFNKKGRDDDDHDSEQYGHQCRRTAIHRQTKPNCNTLMELPYLTNHVFYINAGSYRQVFGLEHTYATPIATDTTKSQQMKVEEKNKRQGELIVVKEMYSSIAFQTGDYEFVRMDAMVAERLTASPRIYDIYGYCGTAIVSEYFPYGDYEAVAVPGSGYQMSDVLAPADQHDANNNNNTNDGTPPPPVLTTSYNEIAPPDKLRIALQMAEGLADLHGAREGPIVHQDVQLSQYLLSADNVTLKLNDFNRAEYMLWDEHKQQYCKYAEGHGNGNWRSPEEYYDNNLNEQVDVYSLGNNLYSILTGLWVFYDADNYANIAQRIQQGETAYINPVYLDLHTSPSRAEYHLATIITHCHEYNPQDRPSIFEVVDFLRKAVEEI